MGYLQIIVSKVLERLSMAHYSESSFEASLRASERLLRMKAMKAMKAGRYI